MLIVLKYGGNAMAAWEGADALLDDVALRVRTGDSVVLVHGGGPQIDAALEASGVTTNRVLGLRVTDAATLAITESVLCGTVNKALVRALMRRGVAAAGFSGQDAATLVARFADPVAGVELGFVGEVESVGTALLSALLNAAIVPVIAPLGITRDGAQALNVNADSCAGAVAGALQADAYVIVTNVDRVRRVPSDPASGLTSLTVSEARDYLRDGIFEDGMRPKVLGALDALECGARSAIICSSGPGALGRALAGAERLSWRDKTTLMRSVPLCAEVDAGRAARSPRHSQSAEVARVDSRQTVERRRIDRSSALSVALESGSWRADRSRAKARTSFAIEVNGTPCVLA